MLGLSNPTHQARSNMTREQLFKIGEKFHREGKVLNAIDAFKDLVNQYPDHIDGWTHLATMHFQNAAFDEALKALDQALVLDPGAAEILHQKSIYLSSISRFHFENGFFLDQQTKEAHEIKTFPSKQAVYRKLDKILLQLIKKEEDHPKKIYQYTQQLARNKYALGKYNLGMVYWEDLKNKIPPHLNAQRQEKERQKIEQELTRHLEALGRYDEAISRLKELATKVDDRYFIMIQIASIYEKMGKSHQRKEVLRDLLQLTDQKWQQTLEAPYISRKFELMKQLEMENVMPSLLQDFDQISPASAHLIKRKKELAQAITSYLQSRS